MRPRAAPLDRVLSTRVTMTKLLAAESWCLTRCWRLRNWWRCSVGVGGVQAGLL